MELQPEQQAFHSRLSFCIFPTQTPNLKELIDNGVIRRIDQVPRGFERITAEQFRTVLELSKANPRFTVV